MQQRDMEVESAHLTSPPLNSGQAILQVEVKGRVNLDKLTAFLEELRVSRSRTVSLGTLSCARAASAADNTHIVEVRDCYCQCKQPATPNADRFRAVAGHQFLLLAGNHRLHGLDLCISRGTCIAHPDALHHNVYALRYGITLHRS